MEGPIDGWLAEVLGASFSRVRSLTFGISSELELLEAKGELFVLRRYLDADDVARHPTRVADEVAALDAASNVLGDLVPRPIAFDPIGAAAGHPAVLMRHLPGTPVIHDLDPTLLVEPLTRLHTSRVGSDLPPFRHWFDRDHPHLPGWSRSPRAWEGLAELVSESEPASPSVFLHRDYHPGNLLWEGGRMTGIVDWVVACRGPAAIDVAHTRCNLVLIDGPVAAERFVREYTRANPSYAHDPWWDAAELLTWDDEFSGAMAFNAFGAGLDLELLRRRADRYAEAVWRSAEDAAP